MKPRIPKGGFFAAKYRKQNLDDLEHRLKESGAQTLIFHNEGLVLGAWKEFPGQGLWADKNTAVAYDLDLTNEVELLKLLDLSHSEKPDPGRLLWMLYRKFGLDFLDRLRGAFGFALWDGEKGNLVVATDPYGIRSVAYSHKSGGGVCQASCRLN